MLPLSGKLRECAWALPLLLVTSLVGGEPHGYRGNLKQTHYRGNLKQTHQAATQLRGEEPYKGVDVTALARTMAADLCATSLKEAGEMRARVRQLEHKLQLAQAKFHAFKYAYEQQSNSTSAPSDDRGSPLAAAASRSRDRQQQWTVRFVQHNRWRQPE